MVHSPVASLRRVALITALIFTGFCAVSAAAVAQPCLCPVVTVDVDADVACNVQLFPESPLCRYESLTLRPGRHAEIPCCDSMTISLVDMNGVRYTFAVGNPQIYTNIQLAPGCCVNAAVKLGPNGCIALRISKC